MKTPLSDQIRSLVLLLLALVTFTGCASIGEKVAVYSPFTRHDGPARIVIDLGEQQAYLYQGGQLSLVSRVSSGREGYDTPAGKFKVIEKDARHTSTLYGAFVRPDNGLVVKAGVDTRKDRAPAGSVYVGAPMPWFLRFQGAHGLHQGNVPKYPDSHGCIRLPSGMARRFYEAAEIGTPVVVRR